MLPVFLDLTDRWAVVVGAGPVGRRKVGALRSAGARVRIVCLEPRPADETDPGIDWICAPWSPAHLADACLVFAAGPADVNRQVVAAARGRGILVCSASEPEQGDFHLPAVLRRGDLVVAVSTGGAAPALAAELCRELERQLDPVWADLTGLLGEFRAEILHTIPDPDRRHQLLRALADLHWLAELREQGIETVRQRFRTLVAEARTESGAGES
jgi:siroheme synthase-like protein